MVPRPEGEHIIGTKWIFHNKTDEEGNVIRNKARLVAQGYSQMEGVDYDERFASIAKSDIATLFGLRNLEERSVSSHVSRAATVQVRQACIHHFKCRLHHKTHFVLR